MGDEKEIIMLEVGILLDKDHEEFEQYSDVYDGKYGYYDESQEFKYASELERAKEEARRYVEDGVEGTYAIITNQGVSDVKPERIEVGEWISYSVELVLFSLAKIGGEIKELINK